MFFNKNNVSNNKLVQKFLNRLSYFETVNLLTVILKAEHHGWNNQQCFSEATATFSDQEKTIYIIKQALEVGLI